MIASSSKEASTCVSSIINASRNAVYQAFLERDILVQWMHPDNMSVLIHVFEPYIGGKFRISLVYNNQGHPLLGKS